MNRLTSTLLGFTVTALAASLSLLTAQAQLVRVATTGTVDFNVIRGALTGIGSGAPVVMQFDVDSANFVDSPNFPVRGYPVLLDTFSLIVGGVSIPIVNPQPNGDTAYFVLRNDDPAVDGFFLSPGVENQFPITVEIPGLAPLHELNFLRTFNDDTPFDSLNILDALGTYGTENLSSFDWSVGRFGNAGLGFNYESISLSTVVSVPEPGMLAFALGLGVSGAGLAIRRRKRSAV